MNSITPNALQQLLYKHPDTILIDVRQPFEHAHYNIGGKLIPLDNIMQCANEIPTDKPVIVYCQKGIRSAIAIQRLEEKFGMKNLLNLEGGIDAWMYTRQ